VRHVKNCKGATGDHVDRSIRAKKGSDGQDGHDDKGAVLILAMVYIIVISAMVATLTGWASNDLNNSTKFQNANEFHYALSSAMNTAIESERYSPDPTTPTAGQYGGTATTLGQCWQPANGAAYKMPLTGSLDGYVVSVWCTTLINLASATTRTMTAYACLSTVTSTNCQASPGLVAVVQYDDYPTPAGPQLSEQCNLETGQCGYSETLVSWTWG
jgi:hypothetical protein